MEQDFRNIISSKKCSKCGGSSAGFKCSACGYTTDHFDTNHWRDCQRGGKMSVRCAGCGQAEGDCTCQPAAKS